MTNKQMRYYFCSDVVKTILDAIERGMAEIRVSLDLNLSCQRFGLDRDGIFFDPETSISGKMLLPLLKDGQKIFVYEKGALSPLELRTRSYYKLVPTDSAPILEIDGVKMHRSKEIDPLIDAERKTAQIVRAGDHVLDTCGGLGYSAFFALKSGARSVVSVEKSREVIHLRKSSPWYEWFQKNTQRRGISQETDHHISFLCSDISTEIENFKSGQFQSIIHDPPRFTSATGDLYGKSFYESLCRVTAPGGRLFHYTGSPKRIKNGDRFVRNAIRRLESAGFSSLEFNDFLQGIFGEKRGF